MAEGRSSAPILAIIAGVLVIAGAAGYFAFRTSSPSAGERALTSSDSPTDPKRERPASGTTAERPALPEATGEAPATPTATGERWSEGSPREYVVNGVRVRDHRTGDHAVFTPSVAGSGNTALKPPEVRPPPDGRAIPATLTSSIGHQVRAVMKECTAPIPAEQRGKKPRMNATITIVIKDKTATVEKIGAVLADVVAGETVDAARTCIEAKSVGLHEPTEEADVRDYDISLSYLL